MLTNLKWVYLDGERWSWESVPGPVVKSSEG